MCSCVVLLFRSMHHYVYALFRISTFVQMKLDSNKTIYSHTLNKACWRTNFEIPVIELNASLDGLNSIWMNTIFQYMWAVVNRKNIWTLFSIESFITPTIATATYRNLLKNDLPAETDDGLYLYSQSSPTFASAFTKYSLKFKMMYSK